MDTTEFLRRVLPSTGLYVIARLVNGKFRHQVCDSIEETAAYALQFDSQGVATYHACAAYRERDVVTTRPNGEVWHQVRTHKNVRALKSFWMDLDVEPGNEKKFGSQAEAIEALVDFCQSTNLPIPMVISSGGGVHIYWTLTDEIIPEAWKPTAEGLKLLCVKYGFRTDPACTSDSARVLRPVGTWNRKLATPTPVECVAKASASDFGTIKLLVDAALRASGIKLPDPIRPVEAKDEVLNQAFAVKRDFPLCSGHKVAEKCAQLRKMRDTRGNISEPHWYAGIQLLCHAVEGDALIHQWSNGYANYSAEETERKIAQIRGQALGPSLCTTFETRNPGGCDGCPFKGKISSPAQLGTEVQSAPAPVIQVEVANVVTEVTLPPPPLPFTRGAGGGIYIEEEGITHKIYEYDAFPTELAYDEQLGYETMRWRHHLPQEGWKECVLQSSLLARPADFTAKLIDNHIQPLIKGKFVMFADSYIRKLRADTKLRQLFKSQGWKKDETEFVLGDKLYRQDEIVQAGFSHGVGGFLTPFSSKGSLDKWRTLTSALDYPGFEAHAFMLLLAFAAPLVKLAGIEGCTVNALGASGIGKSTMAQFMTSVYGTPKGSWVGRDDTELARMQRLGAHNSLPVYMDEATTIAPKALRDLIYAIPTGKNRTSMRQDYSARPGAEWCTIFITSANNSLQSKLQLENQNPEAEGLRLFEFQFPRIAAFGPVSKLVPEVIQDNFGVAGPAYINFLVKHRDEIKADLRRVLADAGTDFAMEDKERFWAWTVALALHGGALARQAGVIDFDPERIRPWLKAETRRMRRNLNESMSDTTAMFADYLNEHIGERLTVTPLNATMIAQSSKPLRELSQRFERDSMTLYVSKKHVKTYFDERHADFNGLRDELIERGILVHSDTKKVLGAGTDYTGGQTQCWKIKMDHPELVGRAEV